MYDVVTYNSTPVEVKVLPTRKYEEKANQPPEITANKCFDHKIEYDNNSEIERESK